MGKLLRRLPGEKDRPDRLPRPFTILSRRYWRRTPDIKHMRYSPVAEEQSLRRMRRPLAHVVDPGDPVVRPVNSAHDRAFVVRFVNVIEQRVRIS